MENGHIAVVFNEKSEEFVSIRGHVQQPPVEYEV